MYRGTRALYLPPLIFCPSRHPPIVQVTGAGVERNCQTYSKIMCWIVACSDFDKCAISYINRASVEAANGGGILVIGGAERIPKFDSKLLQICASSCLRRTHGHLQTCQRVTETSSVSIRPCEGASSFLVHRTPRPGPGSRSQT